MKRLRILCVLMGMAPAIAGAQDVSSEAAAPAAAPVQPLAVIPVSAAPAAEVRDNRWSLWPTFGAVLSDQSDLDSGFTGGLKAVRPFADHFAFELGADFSALETSNAGDYERTSARIGIQMFPGRPYYGSSSSFQPFLTLGAHASSVDFLGESVGAFGPYASLGFQQRFSSRYSLLLEARYQQDEVKESGAIFEDQTFYTWQAMAGLRIALGKDPGDADGDGVPDHLDKCPNTPKGVQVYSDGCPIDTDGDGVPDYLDKCPNTPKGTVVDASGCPADEDGDGVPNDLDRCPGTPRGVMVGPDGCPIDSDGDGIPDAYDKCPNTPKGTIVGPDGCPAADADGDGIPDFMDKCPDTPAGIAVGPDGCPLDSDGDGIPDYLDECPKSPPGAKVLPNGCALTGDCRTPRPGEAVDANGCALDKNFILRGVKFEFDSDRLTEPAKLILNEVAETLAAYPGINVDLEGHTDSVGTDAYNLGLSERRANAVKTYLTGRSVPASRMNPVGYGESRPIDSNETEEGRENNRRVELKVIE